MVESDRGLGCHDGLLSNGSKKLDGKREPVMQRSGGKAHQVEE